MRQDDARSNAGAPLAADEAGADAPGEEDIQTADEAAESDLQAIADSLGITVEQAREARTQADLLGIITQQIYEQRPEVFVGGAVAPPRLYIKGEADEFVRDLVAAAPFAILIIDRQPYSFDDNDRRVPQFARELQRLGFNDLAVGTDITRESLIEATVRRTTLPGASGPRAVLRARRASSHPRGVAFEKRPRGRGSAYPIGKIRPPGSSLAYRIGKIEGVGSDRYLCDRPSRPPCIVRATGADRARDASGCYRS